MMRGTLLAMACVLLASCTRPRPLEPVRPRYPSMLRSANVTGDVTVQAVVDRDGKVSAIRFDSSRATHDIFRASVKASLRAARFRPARRLGVRRTGLVEYVVHFVLVQSPTDSLHPSARRVPSDTVSQCPLARNAHEIVVCAPSTLTRVDVLH
jgi:TonB family protein